MENKEYILDTKNYFVFCPKDDKKRHCAVICPGGGYDHTSNLEAFNVAKKFNDNGYHACVLFYRQDLGTYPLPQKHLAYTISQMRENDKFNNLCDKIISVGFSAGGHLTLSNAIYYKEYGYNSRPDLLVLAYPVVSANKPYSHKGSFNALLGENKDEELLAKLSLEDNVSSDLPKVFLWHSFTDESVPVKNSLVIVEALKQNNVVCEFHMFSHGVHGMSLADETTGINDSRKKDPYIAKWFDMCVDFIKNNI